MLFGPGQQKKGLCEAVGYVLGFVEEKTFVRGVRSSLYRRFVFEWASRDRWGPAKALA